MKAFENIRDAAARNWWVRVMANEFMRIAPAYCKGENLVYLKAVLQLAAEDPDGFYRNGGTFDHVRFYAHKRKGKKLVSVKANWENAMISALAEYEDIAKKAPPSDMRFA